MMRWAVLACAVLLGAPSARAEAPHVRLTCRAKRSQAPHDEGRGAAAACGTAELHEDLARGVEAVPPALRPTAAHPLEIELLDAPADWGFEVRDDRLRLFTYREPADARALGPLAHLGVDQRARLWRRRAVVHALISRWDTRLRWSTRPSWRAISGWEGREALLTYAWAFSRAEGMRTPALDLVTFAEELLVPPESLADLPPDEHVRCRVPVKARFLDARLRAVDARWAPARRCPALDAWTTPAAPPRFEVLFTAPSGRSAQALAGHVLVRVVRGPHEPGGGQVLQLAALVSPLEPPSAYLVRGLSGGFSGVFDLASLADVHREALGLEQRSLRRAGLVLSEAQRVHLAERIWELERVGYVAYRFFKANCATMLRFLLAPVLGDRGAQPTPTPWEAPSQVLDGLAGALDDALETDEASTQLARHAADARAELLRAAPARWRTLSFTSPEARRASYSALSGAPAEDVAWSAQVLLRSLRVERAELDVATTARLEAERRTVLPGWEGPTTDALVTARQRRFEQGLTGEARAASELSELLALDALLRAAPRRPLNARELGLVEAERAARETFEAVAAAVSELPLEVLEGARAEEQVERRNEQAELQRRGVPESGHGHLSLGAGALLTGAPLLKLRAAAMVELLGDQRLRGLGPRASWRLVDASLELTPQTAVHRAGLTLLHLRAVTTDGWGGGGGLDYAFAERGHEMAVSGELLRELAADRRFTRFLLINAGVRTGVRAAPLASFLLAPRVGLEARLQLPGSFGNAVRVAAAWTPRALVRDAAGFEHGVTGVLSTHLRLGTLHGLAFTARAELQAEWRPGTGLSGLAALGVDVD